LKKAPQLDKVRLSFSYTYPEHYWRLQDTMDFDEDYSFSEIEEMLDCEKMATREHRKTDDIRRTTAGGKGNKPGRRRQAGRNPR